MFPPLTEVSLRSTWNATGTVTVAAWVALLALFARVVWVLRHAASGSCLGWMASSREMWPAGALGTSPYEHAGSSVAGAALPVTGAATNPRVRARAATGRHQVFIELGMRDLLRQGAAGHVTPAGRSATEVARARRHAVGLSLPGRRLELI